MRTVQKRRDARVVLADRVRRIPLTRYHPRSTAIANYEPVPRHWTRNQNVTSVKALQLPSETPVNPAMEAPGYCRVSLLYTDLPGSPGEQPRRAVPTWMLS